MKFGRIKKGASLVRRTSKMLSRKSFVSIAALGLFSISMPSAFADNAGQMPFVPTIDLLSSQGQTYQLDGKEGPITSSYVLVGTDETTGESIYNIPTVDLETGEVVNHYYHLNVNMNDEYSRGRLTYADTDANTDVIGHYLRLVRNGSSNVGAGIYNNPSGSTYDGAVLHDVIGDFIETSCNSNGGASNTSHGGGIDNHGIINNVYGDFIGNTIYTGANSTSALATDGAAIRNGKEINLIQGNFIGNYANAGGDIGAFGGGIANHQSINDHHSGFTARIETINANFISNKAKTGGGAIYNTYYATIGDVNGAFINNSSEEGSGGAIYNSEYATIDSVNGVFAANNAAVDGGAIYNADGAEMNVDADFIANTAGENGGAIYNDSATDGQVNMTVSGNFINNSAGTHGGAIYSTSDINLVADGEKFVIKGNTAGGSSEAVYMEGVAGVPAVVDDTTGDVITPAVDPVVPNLNINTANSGEWVINDKINGTAGLYNVNFVGDGSGTVSLFNDIAGGNVAIDSTRLNTINDAVHVYDFNSFQVNGDSSMTVDVDLKNQQMDRITANSYGTNNGFLDVNGMNLLTETNRKHTSILFAQEGLAQNVQNFGGAEGSTHRIYTPVHMYDVQYNVHPDDNQGYFEFTGSFNPSALVAPVVLQAGAQSALNTTMLYAFNHLDTYTKIPASQRLTLMNQNKYAMASTDFNNNLTRTLSDYNLKGGRTTNQGVWIRPYTAFESIPLRHGPKVDSITYGTFVGFDSDFHEHRNGWHSVYSLYGGYNGGYLNFKGNSATLNGGVVGLTDTFYKGNFWTAVTATTGAMIADVHTMYGHEDSTSLYAGIASKTGYNFEFKDGKYILQPMMKFSYSFADTFDYKNSAGVKVKADPLHTIQFHPAVRFIGNYKNGWQPYASAGMVWNFLNQTDVSVGGYQLPDMHIKPYFEYGLGVQKLHGDRFCGFGQAMVRNGGRNGVALTFGFRYSLGREGDVSQKKRMTY